MRVDGGRMRAAFDEMAAIGATPGGGVTRLALGDGDRQARDRFRAWCEAAGWAFSFDDVGNLYGRREGSEPSADPVVIGSHLDTVAGGGRFDGALGVIAGVEVLRVLDGAGVGTRRPVVAVDFTNEEGARFEPAMACSGVLAGRFTVERVRELEDGEGARFGVELDRIGYAGSASARLAAAHAYLELHIEQGPVLEAAGLPVGLVSGIQGIQWVDARFRGAQSHAGATPMAGRRDPLVAAARLAVAARDEALRHPGGMATTGRLAVEPGAINVIPGGVRLSLDLRHPDGAELADMLAAIAAAARRLAAEERVELEFDAFWRSPPTVFDPRVLELLAVAARLLEIPFGRLVSGPGHDAKYMAEIAPAAMIFVRTRNGRSHCEDEDADWVDCVAAADILLNTVLELAGRVA